MRTRPAAAVAIAAGVAWPVLSHAAALAGREAWMPAITAAVAVVIAGAMLVAASSWLARGCAIAVIVAVALAWRQAPSAMLFVPPAVINVALGLFFASTLRPGREPRIARYARLERGGELPADLARYTRRLTWLWTIFFFASALAGAALAALAPLHVWSAYANVFSYAAVALLFVGEYAYRRLRYREYRHAPLHALVALVARDRMPGSAR